MTFFHLPVQYFSLIIQNLVIIDQNLNLSDFIYSYKFIESVCSWSQYYELNFGKV